MRRTAEVLHVAAGNRPIDAGGQQRQAIERTVFEVEADAVVVTHLLLSVRRCFALDGDHFRHESMRFTTRDRTRGALEQAQNLVLRSPSAARASRRTATREGLSPCPSFETHAGVARVLLRMKILEQRLTFYL